MLMSAILTQSHHEFGLEELPDLVVLLSLHPLNQQNALLEVLVELGGGGPVLPQLSHFLVPIDV
jgi:hypothetical protein